MRPLDRATINGMARIIWAIRGRRQTGREHATALGLVCRLQCHDAVEIDLGWHVAEAVRLPGHRNRIDPDRWRPLIMSFQQFYGLGERVQPSTLAEIPEETYRPRGPVLLTLPRRRDRMRRAASGRMEDHRSALSGMRARAAATARSASRTLCCRSLGVSSCTFDVGATRLCLGLRVQERAARRHQRRLGLSN